MILDRLTRLAARMGLDDPIVEPIRAHVAVRIDADGRLADVEQLPERTWLPLPREIQRTSNVAAQALWDKPPYLLGHPSKTGSQKNLAEKRAASRAMHERLHQLAPEDPRLAAAAAFTSRKPYRSLVDQPDANFVLFYDGEKTPIGAHPSARDPLRSIRLSDLHVIGEGICPVTGLLDELVVDNHVKIKPLPGSNSAGGSLVSFLPNAAHGWGQRDAENMTIGMRAYFGYTSALRYLLSNRRIRLTENHTAVWWCPERDHPLEGIVQDLLDGHGERVLDAYDALQELDDLEGHLCFAVFIGAQGRGHVAWFDERPIEAVARALLRHADHFMYGREEKVPSLRRILLSSSRPDSRTATRNVRASTAMALLRSSLGDPPSPQLVKDALRELDRRLVTADDDALDPVRLRALRSTIDPTPGVKLVYGQGFDIKRTDPPYVLGCLFAVMEHIQYRAIDSIRRNKRGGIASRFLREAKRHPARVMPHLQALCREHIIKMQKRRMSGYWHLNDVYLSIQAKLTHVPKRLGWEDQALFMLGYDHMRGELRYKERTPDEEGGEEEKTAQATSPLS